MAVLIQFTTLVIRIDRLIARDPDGVATIAARWSPSWHDETSSPSPSWTWAPATSPLSSSSSA